MALPLLYTLPATARAAYPFILAGTRRGLSSRAIERTIRDAGLSISRTRSILPLMSEIKLAERAARNIKFTNLNATINVNRLPQAITMLRREYSYVVRIKGISPGGQLIDRHTTVSTDRNNMTRAEIEDIARQSAEDEGQSDTLQEIEVQLESGQRRFMLAV